MKIQKRLNEFSTEELKDEIKRRAQVKKQERESVPKGREDEVPNKVVNAHAHPSYKKNNPIKLEQL